MFSQAPLSLIIPCRNGERWLGEAIRSVFEQTVRPMEILVVDDRSTDGSARIARSFGPPVRVIASRGRGCNAARCTGVRESRGEFVAFVDADDRLAPHKHERQLALLERSDRMTIVHTGSVNFWDDGSRPDKVRSGAAEATGHCTKLIFERNPVCGASVMARRATILRIGNYEPGVVMSGDYHLSLVASTQCDFACVPEPLYLIRRHATNSTNRLSMKTWFHWLAQEYFRRECPEAFSALPGDSIRQFMHEPVVRTVKEAYWRRDSSYYGKLLRLAMQFSPEDPQIQTLWRRRWCPMGVLRLRDRLQAAPAAEMNA